MSDVVLPYLQYTYYMGFGKYSTEVEKRQAVKTETLPLETSIGAGNALSSTRLLSVSLSS